MLYYLVTAEHAYTMQAYMQGWGRFPSSRLRIVPYESLVGPRVELRCGSYIFSDLERLSASERELAACVWRQLAAAVPTGRLLNDPTRVLARYELLRSLHASGWNRFRALRATEPLEGLRFPVFLRNEHEHGGSLTPLLASPRELQRALSWAWLQGHRLQDLLVMEFCDTSDEAGIYRKYSAFVVGDRILPRHLIFSRHWLVKKPDLETAATRSEAETYLETNPHAAWLREIFALAGIEYGRIDYSMLNGRPQVWEINTNPTVGRLAVRLTEAFDALDTPSAGMVPVTLDEDLVHHVAAEARARRRGRTVRSMIDTLHASALGRGLRPVVRAFRPY